ncbi:hypothetical protein [Bradyrhizobium sp. USDA 4454]
MSNFNVRSGTRVPRVGNAPTHSSLDPSPYTSLKHADANGNAITRPFIDSSECAVTSYRAIQWNIATRNASSIARTTRCDVIVSESANMTFLLHTIVVIQARRPRHFGDHRTAHRRDVGTPGLTARPWQCARPSARDEQVPAQEFRCNIPAAARGD